MDEEQIWQGLMEFLTTAPPAGHVTSVLDAYQEHLTETRPEIEAKEALAVCLRLLSTRSEAWPILFDKVYSFESPTFNTRPNQLLATAVRGINPGTALDVAMGQGRNAVFLAQCGWTVTGIDVSAAGLDAAQLQARAHGVGLSTVKSQFADFDMGTAAWDLMVFTYTPVPLTDEGTISRIEAALTRGGRVVVESFASPFDARPRRPVDIDPELLRPAFHRFDMEHFAETEEVPDWDDSPQPLVRMIAIRR